MSDEPIDAQIRAGSRPTGGPAEAEHEPDDAAILAWIRGQDEAVEAHLATCAPCRAYALELRRAQARPPLGADAGASTSTSAPARDRARPPRRSRRALLAAGGAAAALLALVLVPRPGAAPRFDLEDVSRSVAEVRGSEAAPRDVARYPRDGQVILRLRGDVAIDALPRPVAATLVVLGPDARTRVVDAVVRRDQGPTIELSAPVAQLAATSTGPRHEFWVVVAPPDVTLEGRAIDALSAEAHTIWPRRFTLDSPGGSP